MISIGTPIWQVDASGRFRSIVGTDVVGPSTSLKQSSFGFEVERNQHFLIVFLSVFSQMYMQIVIEASLLMRLCAK